MPRSRHLGRCGRHAATGPVGTLWAPNSAPQHFDLAQLDVPVRRMSRLVALRGLAQMPVRTKGHTLTESLAD